MKNACFIRKKKNNLKNYSHTKTDYTIECQLNTTYFIALRLALNNFSLYKDKKFLVSE